MPKTLKITDQYIEFECPICGRKISYPSPESTTQNPNIFHPAFRFIECIKCSRIVCRQCIGERKGRLCRDCKD
jgi:hypothetical protein